MAFSIAGLVLLTTYSGHLILRAFDVAKCVDTTIESLELRYGTIPPNVRKYVVEQVVLYCKSRLDNK